MKSFYNNNEPARASGKTASSVVLMVLLAPFIVAMAAIHAAKASGSPLQSDSGTFTPPIYGETNNNIQPVVSFCQEWHWDTCIFFTSTRIVSNDWWLCVTNRIGCKLRLWASDGSEAQPNKADVSAAFNLDHGTTMSNLLEYLGHKHAGPQLAINLFISPHAISQAYRFRLGDLFPMQLDREYKLEIIPMLYKARIKSRNRNTANYARKNGVMADLVEFPPFMVKLLTNGTVVSLKSDSPIKVR